MDLVENANLADGYVSYKWSRTYNNEKFSTDFILLILDPGTGDIVSISKRFNSNIPSNKIKITEGQAQKVAIKYMADKNEPIDIIKTESLIVNPIVDGSANPLSVKESKYAFAITFKKIQPVPGETIVWVDKADETILGEITTK